jgi:hypothetical protein
MAKKFISFKTEEEKKAGDIKKQFLSRILICPINISEKATELCIQVDKQQNCDVRKLKEILINLKKETENFLREIGEFENKNSIVYKKESTKEPVKKIKPVDILSSVKASNDAINAELHRKIAELNSNQSAQAPTSYSNYIAENLSSTRALPNGGMAPPELKSVNDITLGYFEKNKILEDMRKLQKTGQHVHPVSAFKKKPVDLKEFVETFQYLEDVHDYNGSFLIALLKSELEITLQETMIQADLSSEKLACENGDAILLNVYDISGSSLENESKRFLILLKFDELYGILKPEKIIFTNNQPSKFSSRQIEELEKFCHAKKIKYETVC